MTPTPAISTEQLHPAPSLPPTIKGSEKIERASYSPEREVFIFTYKKGHSVISMNFQSESLADAVKESKEVARVQKWTWIGVTPFLRDIKRLMTLNDTMD